MPEPSNTSVRVGDRGPERSFGPITRTDIVRYAGASGDLNRIHHDEPYAIASGFPSVLSIGMLQAGMLATYVTDWLGAEEIRRFKVRFTEPVWPDDVLTCGGSVQSATEIDGFVEVVVDLLLTRQTGGVALTGSASFLLKGADHG